MKTILRVFVFIIVLAELVALVLGAITLSDALSEEGNWYTATVSDFANIREKPDKNSPDAGDLLSGEEVLGIGYENGWVKVAASSESGEDGPRVEAGEGWIREDLLTLSGIPVGQYKNTSGGYVNVRAVPDGEKRVSKIEAGHTVNVERWIYAGDATWGYIGTGYVMFDYFTQDP